MPDYLEIKPDKRFKPGNLKVNGSVVRGNPDTLDMRHLYSEAMPMEMKLNPPIVVSHELAKVIKRGLK